MEVTSFMLVKTERFGSAWLSTPLGMIHKEEEALSYEDCDIFIEDE